MPFNGWNIPSICKMIQIADTIVFQYLLECKPIFFAFSRQRFQSLPFRLFGLFFFLGFFRKSICFLLSPYSFFCYSFFILILYVYLQNILAPELTDRILLTSLPWYIGGITAYSLTSWICLEPTWKRKILNFFISCGIIRIFFLSNVPQAYDGFIWILLLFTGFTFILPWLSVTRFKAGKQD